MISQSQLKMDECVGLLQQDLSVDSGKITYREKLVTLLLQFMV